MEEAQIVLARHEEMLKGMKQEISNLKAVQNEIKLMNETLVMLTTELKHTNEHLKSQEAKIYSIENQPKKRLQQIITAIIAALSD